MYTIIHREKMNTAIHAASLIINKLAEENITDPLLLDTQVPQYLNAKFAFIDIATTCLENHPHLATNFETELMNRHFSGQLHSDVFRILWWYLDDILAYYQHCLHPPPPPPPLPVSLIKEKVLSKAGLTAQIECTICLTSHPKLDTLCVQACQHAFGRLCLLEWKKISQECPLCRANAVQLIGYKAQQVTTKTLT